MNKRTIAQGHLAALFSIFVWATTFIVVKLLLKDFSAIEMQFFRLVLGYAALIVLSPHFLKFKSWREELMFAGAGLCGATFYFLFQNTALTYSLASNVSTLISIAPFFIAIFSRLFLKDEELQAWFFIGFVISIAGIFLISFNGNYALKLNPLGDVLAIGSAVAWGFYSVLMKKIGSQHYNPIQATQKVFFYGILFLLPFLIPFGFRLELGRFASLPNLLNMAFLGVVASALCFVTWNYAVSVLGAIRTSVYIYAIPVLTIVFSAIVLKEPVTVVAMLGVALILVGLWVSERRGRVETEAGNEQGEKA